MKKEEMANDFSSYDLDLSTFNKEILSTLNEKEKLRIREFMDWGIKQGHYVIFNTKTKEIDRVETIEWENLVCNGKNANWVVVIRGELKKEELTMVDQILNNGIQKTFIDPQILYNVAVLKNEGKTREELFSFLKENGLNDQTANKTLEVLYNFIKNQYIKLIIGIFTGALYLWVLIYFHIGGIVPWMFMGIPTSLVISFFNSSEKFKKHKIYTSCTEETINTNK